MPTPLAHRRGFTLIELMVSMIVLGIVAGGLVDLLRSQGRFMDQQEAWRSSRGVARSSLNRLYSDLRNVEAAGGVEAAAAGGKDITLRVPYAFGVMCSSTGASSTLSLLPVDSAMYAGPGLSGLAWRDPTTGAYHYVTAGVALSAGTVANCTGASVTTLPSINGSPAGTIVNVSGAIAPVPPIGTVFFLYRRVRYEFKASTVLPGRTGLWRTLVTTGATEELATPFATTARFNFYVVSSSTPQAAVPTLSTIRGLQLVLNGQSERAPRGSSAPKSTQLTTSVFFTNRTD
jgi:prepilin-type N-terminal cleavage/methylation domain-containing protein